MNLNEDSPSLGYAYSLVDKGARDWCCCECHICLLQLSYCHKCIFEFTDYVVLLYYFDAVLKIVFGITVVKIVKVFLYLC
jgi:hypothetical protein